MDMTMTKAIVNYLVVTSEVLNKALPGGHHTTVSQVSKNTGIEPEVVELNLNDLVRRKLLKSKQVANGMDCTKENPKTFYYDLVEIQT